VTWRRGGLFARPDWVLLGVPDPAGEGVLLYASNQLNSAELELVAEGFDPVMVGELLARVPREKIVLRCELERATMVMAPDYKEAFARLFEAWQPRDSRSTPAVEGPPLALPGADSV
jgi:hypothetical protein